MKPYTEESLTAAEYDYKVAMDDCTFFGRMFNVTYHKGQRSADDTGRWLDSSLVVEHKPEQERMNNCLDALFDAMVELKLTQEVANEQAAPVNC